MTIWRIHYSLLSASVYVWSDKFFFLSFKKW
jgi:hypothetical protein